MSEKQYYVRLTFEWGVDNDGEFDAKNKGDIVWGSMAYDDSVGLQTYAVIPSLNDLSTKAGELGLMKTGMMPFPPDMEVDAEGKGHKKPV